METVYARRALDKNVLAVAVLHEDELNELFDWAVYIGAVKGVNHNNEYIKVAMDGSKVNKEMAVLLFPFNDSTKYRD